VVVLSASEFSEVPDCPVENQLALTQTLDSVRGLSAITLDGVEVALFINAGLSPDLELAATAGSAGIGLFRSELPFLLFDRFPSELEQAMQQLMDEGVAVSRPPVGATVEVPAAVYQAHQLARRADAGDGVRRAQHEPSGLAADEMGGSQRYFRAYAFFGR
jgi:signal transduction protein with GAF and PtsI domain